MQRMAQRAPLDRTFGLKVILGCSIEGLISSLRQNNEGLYGKEE